MSTHLVILFKLTRNNDDQLNSVATWSNTNTKYHLTTYAEGLTVADMDRITNYYCCSVGNMTFLVCYNTTFNLTPPSTVDHYTIPKYSYCHKVTIDPNQKKDIVHAMSANHMVGHVFT